MGQELIRSQPIVAEALDEIDRYFQPLSGWSLKEAMLAKETESRMARTELAQPANFALQVGLTRLWASLGIRPAAVIGHSVGEVVSAYVAGVYTLEEAVRVSYHRSHLQQTMAGQGSMLAVGLPEAEALNLIAKLPGVSVAAVNSFSAVTLSGDSKQLKELAAGLEKQGIFQKFLRVEVAYHSPQMDPLHEPILAALSDLAPKAACLPLYSTAHGEIVPGENWTAEYWWHNVRQPVRFAAGMQSLFEDGFSSFLEIGPHPVLGNSIKECAAHLERNVQCFTSLRRGEPELPRILLTVGELYCVGYDPDWTALAPAEGTFIPGPQYPWQRESHWLESERSKMERLGLPGAVYLNRSVTSLNPSWEVEINRNYFPFLFDHGVQDQTVFAGMGYIEAALSLNQLLSEKPAVVLENVSFERVLIVDYAKLQYLVSEFNAEEGRFTISSRTEGEENSALRHCRGRMLPQSEVAAKKLNLEDLRRKCTTPVAIDAFYDDLSRRGLHYGPAFRSTTEIHVGENSFLLKIDASRVLEDQTHVLHPTLFDAAIQPILYRSGMGGLFVPFSIEQFEYFSRPDSAELYTYGELTVQTESRLVAHVWLMDAQGQVHAHARHMSLQVIDMKAGEEQESPFYQQEWKAVPLSNGESAATGTIILADETDSDLTLARNLAAALPDARLEILTPTAPEGFGKDDFLRLLASEDCANRRRLIVLWGTALPVAQDAATALALNEKLVGLLQAAAISRTAVDMTIVTRGAKSVERGEQIANWPSYSLSAIGLVAQNEYEHVMCRTIDLPPHDAGEAHLLLAAEVVAGNRGEIAYRNGLRFEHVLNAFQVDEAGDEAVSESVDQPIELKVGQKGKLDSLHFEPAERTDPAAGEIEIRIHTASLNYKDLLKVDGRIHPNAFEDTFNESHFGMECAGVVLRTGIGSKFAPGDKVVAILTRGLRSYATVADAFAVKIPDGLGMECSAIPVVYLAAYHGLIRIANLQAGERVLIHHATGGLGIAAMQIARWVGAEIFATAGSDEKQQFLREQGVAHVFSSRNLDFGQQIREVTSHEGVDVVIGAQTGQAMHVSLNLLRTGGRYIEIGKKDIAEDNSLPLQAFNRNLIFASVDMDRLAKERPEYTSIILQEIFDHFAKGDLQTGPTRTYPAREVRDAFEEMAKSRHIGKLLIDFSGGDVDVIKKPQSAPLCHKDGCYIVTGGTSGFGLITAKWLAEQGAGKILLVSRSGKKAAGLEETVRAVESLGSVVEILSVDVTDDKQVAVLIDQANTAPFRLRGIIHGAMVLDDTMMADLDGDRFRRVFWPKVAGAMHLADAAASQAQLDFLVFYSSISAVIGNRGQTNYVAANSALDGLALRLHAKGIPALSINWGALAESGVVARDARLGTVLSSSGITGLSNRQALEAMEQAIRSREAHLGVFLVDWEKWQDANPKLADHPFFAEQRKRWQKAGGNDVAERIRMELADCSKEQRLRALEDHLQDVLARTLGMSKDTISMNRKLNEMGVDSLMVLELSLGIKERIGINFSAMEFLKGPNLQQLAALAESRLWSI